MSSILIKNGRVIDPHSNRDEVVDIFIFDRKIKKISQDINEHADSVIDASGLVVTPGLVDLHVHFREPGREDIETLETGSRAALAGGVTSVVTMPNTSPIADNQTVIEFILNRSKQLNLINIFPTGAITQNEEGAALAEMQELKQAGAIAVSDDGVDVENAGLLLSAMEYAKTHNILMMNHCETMELEDDGGAMHEGWVSTQLGLPSIPDVSEDHAVQKAILLAIRTGVRLHLAHNSTRGAVTAIRAARTSGHTNITGEVAIQHAVLTDEECSNYNTNAKMYPPLRSREHVDAIVESLADGTIDALATDHAPHIEPDKLKPFCHAARGTVGLETSFAAMYTHLVQPGYLSLAQGIALMTYKPAGIIQKDKGTLAIGVDADVSIFNLDEKWTVDHLKLESKGKNSVFSGKDLIGKPTHVIVGGEIKLEDGTIVV